MVLEDNNKTNDNSMNFGLPKNKFNKPFYKRWWFITLIVIVLIGSMGGCDNKKDDLEIDSVLEEAKTEEKTLSSEENQEVVFNTDDAFDYEISQEEDISSGTATRYILHIVIDGKPTAKEIKSTMEQSIVDFKDTKDFDSLTIFAYEDNRVIGSGYTLGKAEYFPYGDIARAQDNKLGDYTSFMLKTEEKEKIWEEKPSDQTFEIYSMTNIEYVKEENIDKTEEELYEVIAAEMGVSVEEVEKANRDMLVWHWEATMK